MKDRDENLNLWGDEWDDDPGIMIYASLVAMVIVAVAGLFWDQLVSAKNRAKRR